MSEVHWRTLAAVLAATALVLGACSSGEPEVELVTPSSVAPAEPLQTDSAETVETPSTTVAATAAPASASTSSAVTTTTAAPSDDAATEGSETTAPDTTSTTTEALATTTTTEAGPDPQVAAFCSANAELDALFDVDVNDSAALEASTERQQELLATVDPPDQVADDFAVVRDATDRYYNALQSTGFDYQLASNEILEIFGDGTVEDASARLDIFEAGNCVRG